MRILIYGGYAHVVGGAQEYLRRLIPEILRDGHRVAYAYDVPIPDGVERVVDSGDIELIDYSAPRTHAASAQIAAWRPDVVYANSQHDAAIEKEIVEKFPAAMFEHDYYGTCASGRKRFAFPRIEACERKFGAMCLALHYPRRCGGVNPATIFRFYQIQHARNLNLA